MFRLSFALLLALSAASYSADPVFQRSTLARQAVAEAIQVECWGKIRTGMVATGGETTGTTITFDRIVWELNLTTDAQRKLASENEKKFVVVIGTLRFIQGTTRAERWIVDVQKMTLREEGSERVGATLSVSGQLKSVETMPGQPAELRVEAAGTTWPLNFAEDETLADKAKPLLNRPVIASGLVDRVPGSRMPLRMTLRVSKLDHCSSATRLN